MVRLPSVWVLSAIAAASTWSLRLADLGGQGSGSSGLLPQILGSVTIIAGAAIALLAAPALGRGRSDWFGVVPVGASPAGESRIAFGVAVGALAALFLIELPIYLGAMPLLRDPELAAFVRVSFHFIAGLLASASLLLWALLLSRWLDRATVLALVVLLAAATLAGRAAPHALLARLGSALLFPLSPGSELADTPLRFGTAGRALAAGLLHDLGLLLAFLALVPRGVGPRR